MRPIVTFLKAMLPKGTKLSDLQKPQRLKVSSLVCFHTYGLNPIYLGHKVRLKPKDLKTTLFALSWVSISVVAKGAALKNTTVSI